MSNSLLERESKMDIPKRFTVTTQDAYNYAASKVFADQQLCMAIKLSGTLDENTLTKAIRLSLDFEPVLGCRFVENDGNPFWERRSDLDEIEIFLVVETASPETARHVFVNEPIHADVDPLVTAKIFRAKDADAVCIKVNHSACDAGGLKEYVSLLSDLYSMLSTCGRCSIQPNLGRRDQSQIFQHTKDPRTLAMKGFPRPTWTLHQKAGSEPLHSFRVIPQAQFEAIKKYAKDKKATVNDVLLTALYRTLFAINETGEGKPMVMQVSIDLRRYLPEHRAEAVCNLSGALYVALERKLDEPFDGTLERVCGSIRKLKGDYPGLESATGLEYLFSQGSAYMEKYMADSAAQGKKYNVTFPLLSNFGVLDKYHFGELEMVKGYITSPVMYPPGFMLGATTFNGEMTFSIGYCGQENSEQISGFINTYVEELPK
jgi:NRPS condensation-like uncharacterized protein